MLKDLEGKEVVIFCVNYIYAGILISASHDLVALREASIVYETGSFEDSEWSNAQRLPVEIHYIERSSVESMGAVVRKK